MHPYLTSDAQARQRTDKVRKIRHWAEQLKAALQDKDVSAFLGANYGGVDLGELGNMLDTLAGRSEEHTSELQSLMRLSYAVFCLKKKKRNTMTHIHT